MTIDAGSASSSVVCLSNSQNTVDDEIGTPYCRRQDEGQVQDKAKYVVAAIGVPLVCIHELEH